MRYSDYINSYGNPGFEEIAKFLQEGGGRGSSSFMVLKKASDSGTKHPSRGRDTFKMKEYKLEDLGNLKNNPHKLQKFRDAIEKGLFALKNEAGRLEVTLDGRKMLEGAFVVLKQKKTDAFKQNKTPSVTSTAPQTVSKEIPKKTSNEPPVTQTEAHPEPVDAVHYKKVAHDEDVAHNEEIAQDEEIDENEGEQLLDFDIISEERYNMLLEMIQKIGSEDSDVQQKKSEEIPSGSVQTENSKKLNISSRTRLQGVSVEAKQHSKKSEIASSKAHEEDARVESATKKDELAAKKKRRHIESDQLKSEIRTAAKNQQLIIDQQVDEDALNVMLKNEEINEEAKNRLLECANVDEKFLTDMYNAQMISDEVYNKFMLALYR